MSYRLRWKHSALEELANLWTLANSVDRRAITNAVRSIERQLADIPEETGESRSGEERIVFEAPVALVFEVHATKHEVRVLQIWCY